MTVNLPSRHYRMLLLISLLTFSWVIQSPPAAHAQTGSSVLTVVDSDGSLWALPDAQAPVLLRGDLGNGATVTDISWNPLRPQLLVVRREMRADGPFDELVRIDLGTQEEEVLQRDIGPQARILRPRWGPDGTWGYARIECCLARQLLRLAFPTRPGSPNTIEANSFLPAPLRETTLVEAGPTLPSGQMLMAVYCCFDSEPASDPSGVYSVSLNFQQSQRLTTGTPGEIIGISPDGLWLATLRPAIETDGHELFLLSGSADPRLLPGPEGAILSNQGRVAADGTILVGAMTEAVESILPTYPAIWAVSSTGSAPRNVSNAFRGAITAFDVTSADILTMAAPGAMTTPATTDIATRVYFGREPESLGDFEAVFPVERGPLSPLAALLTLLQGPTMEESRLGYRSEARLMLVGESSCGADAELALSDGTAWVRFCRDVRSAGIGQDARMAAQIRSTLLQFPSIKEVRLLDSAGRCLMDMSGEDRCLRN